MTRSAAALSVALAACGPAVNRVDVSPRLVRLEAAGAGARLEAVARSSSGSAVDLPVRWSSSDPAVVVVDAEGRLTARQTGDALVGAEVAGLRGEARVAVTIPARAALRPPRFELEGVGSSLALALQVADTRGAPMVAHDVRWRSSDEQVVRVAGGAVRAVGPGQARVEAEFGGLVAAAEGRVRIPDFARLRLEPARLALRAGEGMLLRVQALDRRGQPVGGVPVAWSSSDDRVAAVDGQGAVVARARGRARIRASAGAASAAAAVSVR